MKADTITAVVEWQQSNLITFSPLPLSTNTDSLPEKKLTLALFLTSFAHLTLLSWAKIDADVDTYLKASGN